MPASRSPPRPEADRFAQRPRCPVPGPAMPRRLCMPSCACRRVHAVVCMRSCACGRAHAVVGNMDCQGCHLPWLSASILSWHLRSLRKRSVCAHCRLRVEVPHVHDALKPIPQPQRLARHCMQASWSGPGGLLVLFVEHRHMGCCTPGCRQAHDAAFTGLNASRCPLGDGGKNHGHLGCHSGATTHPDVVSTKEAAR